MSSPSRDRGLAWEREAARFLAAEGLEVLERGYRCRLGEIDLVCRDGATLVLVEVRARGNRHHGGAADSVDRRKQRKLVQAARHYLMHHPEWFEASLRFDVVAIDDIARPAPSLEWIRNAFDGG